MREHHAPYEPGDLLVCVDPSDPKCPRKVLRFGHVLLVTALRQMSYGPHNRNEQCVRVWSHRLGAYKLCYDGWLRKWYTRAGDSQ